MESGFIGYNRCPAAVGFVDSAGGPAGRGKGWMRNLWTFLQFCCEPKTAPENKVYSLKSLKSHSFFIVNLQNPTCALHPPHTQLDFTPQWPLGARGSALGVPGATCPALPGAQGPLPERWSQAGGPTRGRERIRAASRHGALPPCASLTLLEIIARGGEP